MIDSFNKFMFSFAAVGLLAAIGCDSGNLPVYPVKGKITFEGQPMVGGGSISLIPLTNDTGMCAGGTIAEDGSYSLTTYAQDDGSRAGEFRVIVTQVTDREPENTDDSKPAQKPQSSVPQELRIPAKYADAAASPLRMKVEAKDQNQFDFALTRN